MTNEDILNFKNFKNDVENLLNNYITRGFSATAMLPTIKEALEALTDFSTKEIERAKQTEQTEVSDTSDSDVVEDNPTSEATDEV